MAALSDGGDSDGGDAGSIPYTRPRRPLQRQNNRPQEAVRGQEVNR